MSDITLVCTDKDGNEIEFVLPIEQIETTIAPPDFPNNKAGWAKKRLWKNRHRFPRLKTLTLTYKCSRTVLEHAIEHAKRRAEDE